MRNFLILALLVLLWLITPIAQAGERAAAVKVSCVANYIFVLTVTGPNGISFKPLIKARITSSGVEFVRCAK